MIELTVVLGIIVLLTAVAVGSFVGMRQRLAIKTATRQVSAVISMARNSAIATRAASRVVATNVASKQMGGAQHSGPTPGPVAWQGKVIAEVPEVISEWTFEAMYDYSVRPTPSPTPTPTPNPSPPDSFIGTHGNLAVAYGQIADLDDSGNAIGFMPGRIYLNPAVDPVNRPVGNFLGLHSYDTSSFHENAPNPTFDLMVPGTNPIDYALPPDDLRTEAVLAPTPPPSSLPAWWSMYSNNQRYLGRPGMRFEAWVKRATPSPDRLARVIFAKPAGDRTKLTVAGYDTRMDYLIEIWPDATPSPVPNVFQPPDENQTGIKHRLNGQLYACFRDHVTDPPTVDAAYSGRFGIPAGEWTHIMVSWNPAAADRADRLSLYINGVKRTQLCKPIHYSMGNRYKAKERNPVPFISTPKRFDPPAINNYEQDYEPDDENIVDAFRGWLRGVKISRIISRSAALTDVARFALPGDPATVAQRASFGWDEQGRLIDDGGSVMSASNLAIVIVPKYTTLLAAITRGDTVIPVSSVTKFTQPGLLAIGTLEDPADPRSGFRLIELVKYQGKERGGGTPDRFVGCERNYPNGGLGAAHPAGSAVFQAILARVGLKGEVRIDDGAQ